MKKKKTVPGKCSYHLIIALNFFRKLAVLSQKKKITYKSITMKMMGAKG